MNVGDLFVRVLGDTKPIEGDLEGLGDQPGVKRAGTKAGDMFAGAVKNATKVIGPATGALFAEGINSAAQFKDQLATIDTVAGRGAAALNGLDKGALQLSKDTGKPIEDITQGLYDLVSAGVPAGDAMQVLTASTKLAIGGLGTTAQAVDLVSSAMNAYGLKAGDATHITDIFAKAVQDGKVTTAQLGESIANVAPIAAQAGISLEEISAGYARLTATGVPAAEASTKMRSAIVALISPNEALNRIQARTGINFAQLAKDQGLATALQKLREVTGATGNTFSSFSTELEGTGGKTAEVATTVKKFQKQLGLTDAQANSFITAVGNEGMGQALTDLARKLGAGDAAFSDSLGRVEAYQFALSSTGDAFKPFQSQVEETFKATGLAAEQAAIKMDSPVEAGKRLAATFKATLIEGLGPFADSLGPLVIGLNQTGGALGALIRPATLVGGLFGKLAFDIGGPLIKGVFAGWKGVGGSFSIAMQAATESGMKGGRAYALGSAAGNKLWGVVTSAWDAVRNSGPVTKAVGLAGAASGRIYAAASAGGSFLVDALSPAWKKVVSSGPITSIITAGGKAWGSILGKAVAGGFVVVALVELGAELFHVNDELGKQMQGLLAQNKEFVATATRAALEESRRGLEDQMKSLRSFDVGEFLFGSAARQAARQTVQQMLDEINGKLDTLPPDVAAIGAEIPRALNDGLTSRLETATGGVTAAAGDVGKAISGPINTGATTAVTSVQQATSAILTAIKGLRDNLVGDATAAAAALYDPILKAQEVAQTQAELAGIKLQLADKKTTAAQVAELINRRTQLQKQLIIQNGDLLTYGTQAEQISKIKSFLASKFWVDAYRAATPEQRAALDAWKVDLQTRLDAMTNAAQQGGTDVRDGFTGPLAKGAPAVTHATQTMVDGAKAPLANAAANATRNGTNLGENFADGIESKTHRVEQAASKLAGAAGSYLKISSPAERGPLSVDGGPGRWGEHIPEVIAEGIDKRIAEVAAAASRAASAVRDNLVMGAATPAYGGFAAGGVTADGVRSSAPVAVASAPAAGTKVTHINVDIEGLLKAETPFEVADTLRRFAENKQFDGADD